MFTIGHGLPAGDFLTQCSLVMFLGILSADPESVVLLL